MTEEVMIRVKLDTAQAMSDLRDLEEAAQGLGIGGGGGVGVTAAGGAQATGGFSLPKPVSAGLGMITAPTKAGIGAIASEFAGTVGSYINPDWLAKMGADAAGSKAARNDVAAAFGMKAGMENYDRRPADRVFDHLEQIRQRQARGQANIQADPRYRYKGGAVPGFSAQGMTDAAIQSINFIPASMQYQIMRGAMNMMKSDSR